MANFTPIGVEAVIKNERGFMSGINGMQAAITGFAAAAGMAAIQGVAKLTQAVAGLAVGTVESAISVESAFAGVIKTTDGLIDETGQLTEAGAEMKQEFRDLAKEVPTAVEELMAIGELGGQLGIARADLIDFTEVIAAMGVSTNLTTEEAASDFAKISNIMGTTKDEGSAAFGKLGSTIVALGNNFATTERDISAFALRIAGAGEIAGLTEADVLGIGAAMSSVGVEAEAGGTAVQKVLLGINEAVIGGGEQLEIYAATAGLSAEQFAKLWEEDAGAGFEAFVEGLGAAGDDAIGILDALELKDQRLTRAFLSLANAGDLTEDALRMASDAWAENSALTTEAGQRYATMESQIGMVKNQVRDFGITIGEALMPFLQKALEIAQPFIQQIGERLPGLLNTYVIPAIEWLMSGLQTLIGFVTENAGPAFEGLASIWQEHVVPVLDVLRGWFEQLLPLAIDVVMTYWNSYLVPLFQQLQAQWDEKLKPALADLWAWLQERIPQAIETAKQFWEETLKPALQVVWSFFIENIIPILADVAVWLLENIPKAIDTAAEFWTQTLQPALNDVWEFIDENVIPIIKTVVEWLEENIPKAIDTATWAWEQVILPALTTIWDFVDKNLMPIFTTLEEFMSVTLTLAIEALALLWETVLQPALEAVWEFIDENIMPIWEKLRKDTAEHLQPALQTLSDFLDKTLGQALSRINEIIKNTIDRIQGLIDKIREWRGTKTPKDFEPGSPPPLYYALMDIGAAMANLSQVQIPNLAGSMQMLGGTSGMVAAPAMATTNNNTFNFNNTITGGMSNAAFQARTLRTVTGAVA